MQRHSFVPPTPHSFFPEKAPENAMFFGIAEQSHPQTSLNASREELHYSNGRNSNTEEPMNDLNLPPQLNSAYEGIPDYCLHPSEQWGEYHQNDDINNHFVKACSGSPKKNVAINEDVIEEEKEPDISATEENSVTPQPDKSEPFQLALGSFNSITSQKPAKFSAFAIKNLDLGRSRISSFDESKKKQKCCNCKKSYCLKMYCECFASGSYCEGCNCTNCHNLQQFEADRLKAIQFAQYRSPKAFEKQISIGIAKPTYKKEFFTPQGFKTKCNCPKSGCQNGYCECYKKGMKCSAYCNCVNCKNSFALHSYNISDTLIPNQAL